MASLFYELSAAQVVSLATIHSVLQGSLIPLLVTFLSTNRRTSMRFKAYVIAVHFVALGQTIMHVTQVFDLVESRRSLPLILLAHPLLTIILNASVQGFFLFRCYCIFRRRLLHIAPFMLVYLMSVVSGLLTAAYHMKSLTVDVTYQLRVVFSIWILSAFVLDLGMTTTTMIYLYRSRTGLGEHDGAFSAIWQITWVGHECWDRFQTLTMRDVWKASAAPPLILMVAVIVAARGIKGLSRTEVIFVADMTGKFFVLSLMISLVGRGYIRQKLDGLSKHVDPLEISLPNVAGPLPTFVPGVSIKVETTRTFASSQIASVPQRISLTHQNDNVPREFALVISRSGSDFDISLPTHHAKSKTSS